MVGSKSWEESPIWERERSSNPSVIREKPTSTAPLRKGCNTGYLKYSVNEFVYSARLGLTVWNRQSWEPGSRAQLKWLHAPVLGTLVFCLFVCCLLFIGTVSGTDMWREWRYKNQRWEERCNMLSTGHGMTVVPTNSQKQWLLAWDLLKAH